jgi:8-amino-7-oxononanoate synthase
VRVYPHRDLDALDALLAASRAERKLVVSDGVFSMDGDVADVTALLALAERHDALLLVDDAHGFGVLGPQGRGCAAGSSSPRLLYLATLSKAAGGAGAFVAGDGVLVEWLLQRARSYVFGTAMPPAVAEAARAALRVVERDEWRRARLARHVAALRAALQPGPGELLPSTTPIQPLVLGDNASALAAMQRLWQRGLWVPAIRPPTVPVGRARLRISLSAAHDEADVDRLIDALTMLKKK